MVDGRFFAHFFWKVEGTVHTHVNSRVAHMWLPCRMVGGGIPNFGKLGKFGKLQISKRSWGALVAILDLMSINHFELLKMAST